MNFRHVCLIVILWFSTSAAAVTLDYYLPKEDYNPNIPTPESVLGWQVGEWHVRHDLLVNYFMALDKASDRVSVKVIGYSHEQRPLLHVVFTSTENHAKLDQIKANHIKRLASRTKPNHSKYPLIVNLNYSVHGDESSGSNASLLAAYYLAASNSDEVNNYLNEMVIVMDPSLNPDGLSRFAQWANQHKGNNLNADAQNREHIQDWIRGRVNHYWFDLNRDWLLLQHPESRARIAEYHQWRPNVLTDHHEMGTHSTFFFQPGIPSRKNPFTPEQNVVLTKELATYHAEAFDEEDQLYFTEEAFDDFYAGKGSTYPDLHGSIGILFEQGSSRGHLQESINGDVEFPLTIKNQFTATFSTLKGSYENKVKLMDYQWKFERDAKVFADGEDKAGFVVGDADLAKLTRFVDLLQQHNIASYKLEKSTKINGMKFNADSSVFVPLEQSQARLIASIFSELTSFNDNTFYDVSSWNLAMAFNLAYQPVESKRQVAVSKSLWQPTNVDNGELKEAYSYALDWQSFNTPAVVYELLKHGIKVRAALKPLTMEQSKSISLPAGTMFVHAGLQTKEDWRKTLISITNKHQVKAIAIDSGLSSSGIDLGSRAMLAVELPKVLVVGGFGTNPYEVGETWYAFDRHVGFSPTIIEKRRINRVNLNRYTHIILTDGSYNKGDEQFAKNLKEWVGRGGVVWGQKRAALWLAEEKLLNVELKKASEVRKEFDDKGLSYADKEALRGRQRVAGAFFEVDVDLSHPLAFGLTREQMPLFKNGIDLLLEPTKPFIQVVAYTETPLLAGYADQVNIDQIAKQTALVGHRFGQGVVIGMTDNPNFRAITYGSQKLLFNALFLAKGISH